MEQAQKERMEEILSQLTLEEKLLLLNGKDSKLTYPIERLGIKSVKFVDGPHGVREYENENFNATHFPSMCCVGATWDTYLVYQLGEALAEECIERDISLLIAPGINIKRNILCGRNYEYVSEDPVVSGEVAAAYINGIQSKGIGSCLKHFAVNSQETDRLELSAEVDERTLREIYLKGFEIAVKKSHPESLMSAYNKVNAVWCSENRFLLTEVLREEWNYEGFVVSDWGAVRDSCKSLRAGIDMEMPYSEAFADSIKKGLSEGAVTEVRIDEAARRVLGFVTKERPKKHKGYDREKQHKLARSIAAAGTVLLKNDHDVLPLTREKYRKIEVLGGFAENPIINGQGSAEVYQLPEYTDSPLAELKKLLPDVEITYHKIYDKMQCYNTMQWPLISIEEYVRDADAVILFMGSMESEESENFDRNTARLNPFQEYILDKVCARNKKLIVVLQTGSAVILSERQQKIDALVEMWFGGEAAGGAIADILTGQVNPSGKLTETFPRTMRTDLKPYRGDYKLEYNEKLEVGYRYYDRHPDEIMYPFGHGLSYTSFTYSNPDIHLQNQEICVSFNLQNTGACDGSEVVQVYVNDPVSTVTKPIKELKAFQKIFLRKDEAVRVSISVPISDLAYYNTMLHEWVVEQGEYRFLIGASSQDIRLEQSIVYDCKMPYTMEFCRENFSEVSTVGGFGE